MKTTRIKFILFLSTLFFIFNSCRKPNNDPPVADTEVNSALDAIWSTFVITDIEQQCAFTGEMADLRNFYVDVPGSINAANASGTMTPANNPNISTLNVGFYNTKCYDGRYRNGSIFMSYAYNSDFDKYVTKSNPNAKYFHDYGFVGRFSFSNYEVDGWEVQINEAKHGYNVGVVSNIMPENYVASQSPIKWRILGDFILKHPSDASKNMEVSVDLTKSLLNSNDLAIYNQSLVGDKIKWSDFIAISRTSTLQPKLATRAALIAYTGTVSGTSSNGERFRMIIDNENPLIRDFLCYPDKIGSATNVANSNVLQPVYYEFHPFSKGVVSFTTACTNVPDINVPAISESYPRQVFFANEDSPGLDMQCDNAGTVLIKGISYKVELKK